MIKHNTCVELERTATTEATPVAAAFLTGSAVLIIITGSHAGSLKPCSGVRCWTLAGVHRVDLLEKPTTLHAFCLLGL